MFRLPREPSLQQGRAEDGAARARRPREEMQPKVTSEHVAGQTRSVRHAAGGPSRPGPREAACEVTVCAPALPLPCSSQASHSGLPPRELPESPSPP